MLFIPCQDHGISFSAHTFEMNYFYTERILDLSSSAFNPLFSDWKNRTSLRRVQGVWGNVHFQFSSDLLVIWYYIDRISPFPNLLIFLIISSCSLLIYGNLTAKFCHTGYCCFLPILEYLAIISKNLFMPTSLFFSLTLSMNETGFKGNGL